MAEKPVEKFAPHGGQVTGALGLLIAAALLLGWVVDADEVPLWVPAAGLLLGVLVWATVLRPRVRVEPGTLVLRNPMDTVRVPLAAIEEVTVRQVLTVRVGGRRLHCAGSGRNMRQVMRSRSAHRVQSELGAVRGLDIAPPAAPTSIGPGMAYGDYVELRLADLIAQDRTARGLRPDSPELYALGDDVRRERAWPEIVAVAAAVVFLVAAVLLGSGLS